MKKSIPIEESQLYNLKRKSKLEALLGMPRGYLSKPIDLDNQYNEFSELKKDGVSKRYYRYPAKRSELEKYQWKLFKYLNQIIIPEWVKSSQKGESYITNASVHKVFPYGMKMDISSFYDSASYKRIRRCFLNVFHMDSDIAEIVARLLTYQKDMTRGVPTGGAASMRLMYFTYQDMYKEIFELSEKEGINLTVYVDDLSFSSNHPLTKQFADKVKTIVRNYGLTINDKKTKTYSHGKYRCYTGVGIYNGQLRVPNHLHKEIMELFLQCKKSNSIKDMVRLRGKVNSARQIEPEIFPGVYAYLQGKKLEIDRYYRKKDRKSVECKNIKHDKKKTGLCDEHVR